MNFLLTSPRLAVQKGDFLGSGVPYWPLELAIFAEFLRQKRHKIEVHDLFGTSPSTLEDYGDFYFQGLNIKKSHLKIKPEVILIYAISYMSLKDIEDITAFLKQRYPHASVCIFENSQAVTGFSLEHMKETLFKAGADFLLVGEIYANWSEILEYIRPSQKERQSTPKPVNVIDARLDTSQVVKRLFQSMEKYPYPAWDLFPYKSYWDLKYSHGPKAKKFFPILTSRGCPYPCSFCVVPTTNERKFRGRTEDDVVGEMIFMVEKFGVNNFQVEDLNPTVIPNRWLKIAELILERNLKVKFGFVSGTKAETIKITTVEKLALAGLEYVSISPESGSSAVMKRIGKPFDYEHGVNLIKECKRYGVYTQACFLVGYPNETEEDHQASKSYIRQLMQSGLDEVAVFIVSPFAGSNLFKEQKINLNTNDLISFSPKGREGYEVIEYRRKDLINLFFKEKFKQGFAIWLQGLRSLFGTPKTKMENLPLRVLQISYFKFSFMWKSFFNRSGEELKNNH